MEDVLSNVVPTGESSGNASLKEGESPPLSTNSGRSSPPPDCAICLSRCRNKCFTDSCLHQFCFNCLLTWSKIKAECPLCKQPFKSIIHNVLSNNQYEEYLVEQEQQQQQQQADEFIDLSDLDVFLHAPRFRYTTTLTLHRRESLAIQRLLMRYPLVPALPPAPAPVPNHGYHRCQTLFRRSVYRHNLRARPLPDITGRYRECSSHFYRHNPAQMHRLVPWLKRELSVVACEAGRISLLAFIMEKLPRHDIHSLEMERCLTPHLHAHTRHFLHELGCFASSPYDMVGYDRAVSYEASRRLPAPVAPVAPVSETVSDTDSDIVLLSPSTAPGPSRSRRTLDSVVTIRTVSPSDTDDSSDGVVMVGYAAPPSARTPEVVDLLASDSDAVVVEELDPPTAAVSQSPPSPQPSSSGLVKISLKRGRPRLAHPNTDEDSDSDQNAKRSKRARPLRRARFVSRHSASTECTDRDTDSSSSDSSCTGASLFSGARSPHCLSRERIESTVTLESEDTSLRRSEPGQSSTVSACGRDSFVNNRRNKKNHKKSKRQSRSSRRSKSGTRPKTREKLLTKGKNKRAPETSDSDDTSRWNGSVSGSNSKLHSYLKDRSPGLPSTSGCSTLLDVVSESVLAPDNTVLSVNRREGSAPRLTSPTLIPRAFSYLLDEINDDFFNQPRTSSLAPPFDSDTKPLYFSVKKEEKE